MNKSSIPTVPCRQGLADDHCTEHSFPCESHVSSSACYLHRTTNPSCFCHGGVPPSVKAELDVERGLTLLERIAIALERIMSRLDEYSSPPSVQDRRTPKRTPKSGAK